MNGQVGVTDAIARGLAMGSASHGTGTARAMELGAIEGAIGGLAIGLMGLITISYNISKSLPELTLKSQIVSRISLPLLLS